jgi:hypothetical protein
MADHKMKKGRSNYISELIILDNISKLSRTDHISELSPTSCPWHTPQACLWRHHVHAYDIGQVHACETVHEHAHDSFKCMPMAYS